MLFNSFEFIFGFFPITVAVFFCLARWSHPAAAAWLALASLFFYGWWNWVYVPLLLASAAFNYTCGVYLARLVRARGTRAAGALGRAGVVTELGMVERQIHERRHRQGAALLDQVRKSQSAIPRF